MSLGAVIAFFVFMIGLLIIVGFGVLLGIFVCVASLKKSVLRQAKLNAAIGAISFGFPLFLWRLFGVPAADPIFVLFVAPLACGAIGCAFGLVRLAITLGEVRRAANDTHSAAAIGQPPMR